MRVGRVALVFTRRRVSSLGIEIGFRGGGEEGASSDTTAINVFLAPFVYLGFVFSFFSISAPHRRERRRARANACATVIIIFIDESRDIGSALQKSSTAMVVDLQI